MKAQLGLVPSPVRHSNAGLAPGQLVSPSGSGPADCGLDSLDSSSHQLMVNAKLLPPRLPRTDAPEEPEKSGIIWNLDISVEFLRTFVESNSQDNRLLKSPRTMEDIRTSEGSLLLVKLRNIVGLPRRTLVEERPQSLNHCGCSSVPWNTGRLSGVFTSHYRALKRTTGFLKSSYGGSSRSKSTQVYFIKPGSSNVPHTEGSRTVFKP